MKGVSERNPETWDGACATVLDVNARRWETASDLGGVGGGKCCMKNTSFSISVL